MISKVKGYAGVAVDKYCSLSTGQDNRMFGMRIADRVAQSWGEEESRVERSPRLLG